MNIHIVKCICLFGILFFNFSFCALTAQDYYVDYTSDTKEIYSDIIDLKLSQAALKIKTFRKDEPYNLAYLHLENYLDFFTIFISEDEYIFKQRSENKNRRLEIIEKNLDDSNPYKRFVKAEIHLQWALTRSKFNQLFKSGREVYKAYNLLTENQEQFPDFIYNKKSLSILHALIETISIANVFKSILGLKGSINLAKIEIEKVIEYGKRNEFIFIEEADAIKALILFYQANEKDEAWSFIQNSSLNIDESLLSVFLVSKLAQRIGENQIAIDVLKNRPTGPAYSKFAYLDYQMGLSLLRKLNPDCITYLLRFVESFEGKHFIKEAYQKLAWAALIFDGDIELYKHYMALIKTKGDNLVDDDKQAFQESKSDVIPNVVLLKSRLLFDGGYFEKAFDLLNENNVAITSTGNLKLEYSYRRARVLQKLKRYDEAKTYFDFLIENYSKSKEFYACNAALQMGLIEERLNNSDIAESYYRKCLTLKPKMYRRSLHQKAKSGLERIVK